MILGEVISYAVPENARDVSKAFYMIRRPETELLNQIAIGNSVGNTKHYWWDDVPQVKSLNLSAAYTSGDNAIHVPDTSALRPKMMAVIDATVYRVTSITSGTVAAVAVADGGADAAHANGAEIVLLGAAALENDGVPDTDWTPKAERFNVSQIWNEAIKISRTQRMANREVPVGDLVAEMTEAKLYRLALGLDRSLWTNPRVSPADNTTPRVMGGVPWFIKQYGYVPAASAFNRNNFDAFLLTLDKAGAVLTEVWMNPADLPRFDGIDPNTSYTSWNTADRGREAARTYHSQYGHNVTLKTSMNAPVGKICAFRAEDVKLSPFNGSQFQVQEQGKDGDGDSYLLVGEYTAEIRNASTMGIFTPNN